MSVRERVWVTRKGERKSAWVVDYTDQHGARVLKTFKLKKAADKYHREALGEVDAGTHTAPSRSITVRQAAELWLKSCSARVGHDMEQTTFDAYAEHCRLHIVPYLGAYKLSALTTAVVRTFEDNMLSGAPEPHRPADEPRDWQPGRKRSHAMVRKVMVRLGQILADMQDRALVARNTVRERSKNRKHNGNSRKRRLEVGVDIPTPEEISTLINSLPDDQWRPLIMTAAFTGLRASELRGLRWKDVELDKAVLHVRQRADRLLKIGRPKSEAGARTVPLPSLLVNTLRQWKLRCPKGDHGLVFPNGAGKVEYYNNWRNRGLIPAMKRAGLHYTSFHPLRHFYASLCINRKADGGMELPLKNVSVRMGHSSITLTADTYGHLFPQAAADASLDAVTNALVRVA